jgi:hypothetical protein
MSETAYIPDPRTSPPTWAWGRDLHGLLYRRTVTGNSGVVNNVPVLLVAANPKRVGVICLFPAQPSAIYFIGPTSAVGITSATGMPGLPGRSIWLPTSAAVWVNSSGGAGFVFQEVFFI